MRCSYCYDRHENVNLDPSVPKLLAELVHTLNRFQDKTRILFIGGEPSLRPSLMQAVIDATRLPKYEIMTNGYAWNTEFMDFLASNAQHLVLTISYDGLYQELRKPNSKARVEANIEAAKSLGIHICLTCTYSQFTDTEKVSLYENMVYLASFGTDVMCKRCCEHSTLGDSQSYLKGLQDSLPRLLDLVVERHRKGQRIYLPSHVELNRRTVLKRSGTFSCDEYVCNDIIVDTDGTLYPCEVYLAHKMNPLGTLMDIVSPEGFCAYETYKVKEYMFPSKGEILNICPYYNEVINGNRKVISYKTVNSEVDTILYEAREQLDSKERSS